MSKVTNSYWFNSNGRTIGIIEVETEYDGLKYYIGIPKREGGSQKDDELEISEWGSMFPKAAAQTLFYGAPLKEST
jgi:hypothetical protein